VQIVAWRGLGCIRTATGGLCLRNSDPGLEFPASHHPISCRDGLFVELHRLRLPGVSSTYTTVEERAFRAVGRLAARVAGAGVLERCRGNARHATPATPRRGARTYGKRHSVGEWRRSGQLGRQRRVRGQRPWIGRCATSLRRVAEGRGRRARRARRRRDSYTGAKSRDGGGRLSTFGGGRQSCPERRAIPAPPRRNSRPSSTISRGYVLRVLRSWSTCRSCRRRGDAPADAFRSRLERHSPAGPGPEGSCGRASVDKWTWFALIGRLVLEPSPPSSRTRDSADRTTSSSSGAGFRLRRAWRRRDAALAARRADPHL